MDNSEIKKANRKALPKFILIMVISLLVGGLIGFCAARYGLDTLASGLKSGGAFFGTYIAPWLMVMTAVIVPVVCVLIYRTAKKLLSSWDGENEEISDAIDHKLSVVVWITTAALIVSDFLIAAAYSGSFEAFKSKDGIVMFFVALAAFFAIMIEGVIIQQKCVDAAKKTNPEKTASFFDLKFQKKWMDCCDEAEKIMVGKCAFKAFTATNAVCTVLSTVFALCALVFGISFLPSLAVCLIWLVNQSVYCREALKYSKAGNKIS